MRQPPAIYSAQALSLLCQGIEILAEPLALTLGPTQRVIMHELGKHSVELLTDSSTIARRVVQLPERSSNMGAMLLRTMLLELHERCGDGAATATVIARAMVREGRKMIAAGANPVMIVRGMQHALTCVERALQAQARPINGLEELVALATGVTGDAALSEILGQMFEIMGEHATVIIQDIPTPHLDHEYIKGGKWDGYIPSPQLLPPGMNALTLHQPLIVLTDEDLKTLDQVQPMLELALNTPGKPPLLVLARSISDTALTTLIANHTRGILTTGLLVLSAGFSALEDDLNDIAALTGGQVISEMTGHSMRAIQPHFLGRAAHVVLERQGVIIADGAGDKRAIQNRISATRAALKQTSRAENGEWDRLRMRLARLAGGIGVLKLGAQTEQERDQKKEQVRKALRVLESAYEGGLVPGGGAALLACIPALHEARACCEYEDEVYGVAIVEAALKAPFLQIVANAGKVYPPLALDEVERAGPGYGFDALRGEYVDMAERGILDSLSVTRAVLRAATSVASMAITTSTLVFPA